MVVNTTFSGVFPHPASKDVRSQDQEAGGLLGSLRFSLHSCARKWTESAGELARTYAETCGRAHTARVGQVPFIE